MKVFVTGGTGFVGRYVVRELLGRKHRVSLGVRDLRKALSLFGSGVEVYEVNFSNRDSIREALKNSRAEVIIHLIGILLENRRKGLTFENVHYLYSANLYEVAKELGIKRAVHMSALGTHEEAPSHYHRTKWLAEEVLRESGLSFTILRPSLILGPEQRLFFDMDRITRILPVVLLPEGGRYRFQPVDVRDVAQCFVEALEKKDAEGMTYELCGSNVVAFRELLKDIFTFWGRRVLMLPVPKWFMYYMGRVAETILQPPPFSSDQMLMMWKDNVCGLVGGAEPGGVRKLLGREPVSYGESLSWALKGYAEITS